MLVHITRSAIMGALFLFIGGSLHAVSAASLQFDPATVSTNVNQNFEMKIKGELGTETVTSVDAYILYDQALLEAVSVASGTFFPTVVNSITTPGKVYIGALVDDPASSKTGSGIIGTITFKAKANGTATLRFDCTQGSTKDSNINKNDANATDVITCSSNNQSTVAIGGAAGTATPTPTRAAAAVATTPLPTSLPQSGIVENMTGLTAIGALLFVIGIGARFLL